MPHNTNGRHLVTYNGERNLGRVLNSTERGGEGGTCVKIFFPSEIYDFVWRIKELQCKSRRHKLFKHCLMSACQVNFLSQLLSFFYQS